MQGRIQGVWTSPFWNFFKDFSNVISLYAALFSTLMFSGNPPPPFFQIPGSAPGMVWLGARTQDHI